MKKKIILGAVLLTAAIGASASIGFISWCGKQTVTVTIPYFNTPQEAEEFYQELNVLLCGSEGSYTLVP